MIKKCYFDGEAITARGSIAETFFFIKKGNVTVMSVNGKEIKRQYVSGDLFGLAENLVNGKWPFTTLSRGFSYLYVYKSNTLHSSLGHISPNYKNFVHELSRLVVSNRI